MLVIGKVIECTPHPAKDYIKLVLRVHTPYDFKYLHFCVWDRTLLPSNLPVFALVCYTVKNNFNKLVSFSEAFPFTCKACGSYCNERDIIPSRISEDIEECTKCSNIVARRQYISSELKLKSVTEKTYEYSAGLYLTFTNAADVLYFTIIFKNNPLYNIIRELKLHKFCFVQGWIDLNDLKGCGRVFMKIYDLAPLPLL